MEDSKEKQGIKGLVRLRSKKANHATYSCENCKKTRYSPCGCIKKK